jgi:predicted O-linked N-acetylglucosamine transferase (SPINDLY family)
MLAKARAAAQRAEWDVAARLYQQVLTLVPDQAEALESLGSVLLRLQQPAQAAQWLDRARKRTPSSARLLGLLARAQRQSGALADAVETYRSALAVDARQAQLWVELGLAQNEAREPAAAVESFSKAIQLEPHSARLWHALAQALCAAGKPAEGLQAERQALAKNPWLAEAHLGEAVLLEGSCAYGAAMVGYFVSGLLPNAPADAAARLARLENAPAELDAETRAACAELAQQLTSARDSASAARALARQLSEHQRDAAAVICLEHAFTREPSADVASELAQALWRMGQRERAQARLLEALDLAPRDVAAYRLCGSWLASELGFGAGEARWQRLVAECPDDVVALVNLGAAAQRMGRPSDAVLLQRRAIELRPDLVEPYINLGAALCDQGSLKEAMASHGQVLKLEPRRWAVRSNLLLNAHFDPATSVDELSTQHREFGRALCEWVGPAPGGFDQSRDPERRLRIGYVSPDFNDHPVSYFLEPVLAHHDAGSFDVYCYSDVARPDATTARLRRLASVFRACGEDDDVALAERIRSDRIDILVDLAGHGLNNRLPVFARKPSPVQVTWLGYFDTTGLSTIDYRIADAHSVPNGAERLFVEQVVRLPRSSTCFLPRQSPEVVAPPCLNRGHVTFGCFSNPAKLNRDVVATFGRILRATVASHLLLKYHTFADPGIQARFVRWFAEEGIGRDRILFQGHAPVDEFLAAYGEIDIALDTFPYSGETTALHTLWMGVPIVALEGKNVAQRLASRVLRVAELDDWVARSPDEFVRIALRLAGDRTALAAARQTTRQRLLASPLLDHRGFTRELEAAYRSMWQRWCASANLGFHRATVSL